MDRLSEGQERHHGEPSIRTRAWDRAGRHQELPVQRCLDRVEVCTEENLSPPSCRMVRAGRREGWGGRFRDLGSEFKDFVGAANSGTATPYPLLLRRTIHRRKMRGAEDPRFSTAEKNETQVRTKI